jgi:predicted PhzF superfamily epimerase YddE/YHI9
MKQTIYQVDAFTDKLFKGNPAGVMLCETFMSSEWMQNIAMEMNSLQISKRTGKLKVKMSGNDRVEISGRAITVFGAELKI